MSRLALVALLVLSAGSGSRDPWPPDEPRFATIAADLAQGGDWLVPRIAGLPYSDKPPLVPWLIALELQAGLPLGLAVRLPALVAALTVLATSIALVAGLHGRRAGLAAGWALLPCVQFLLQAHRGQLDGPLVAATSLAAAAMLWHLLRGPHWAAWAGAGIAIGLGCLAKIIGFVPLALAVPAAWAWWRAWPGLPRPRPDPRWLLAPVLALVIVAAWLLPAIAHAAATPELTGWADDLLWGQTVHRYLDPWHHHQPPGWLLLQALLLWLPLSLLGLILARPLGRRLGRRDPRFLLPLGLVAVVLLGFSLSPGQRGTYAYPALPPLVWAVAPLLPGWWRHLGERRRAVLRAVVGTWLAAAAVGPWIFFPLLDDQRSARSFMAAVGQRIGPERELGLVAWKEQFHLFRDRDVVVFAHRPRSQKARRAEALAALRWLLAAPNRLLLAPATALGPAIDPAAAVPLGHRHREDWLLVPAGAVQPAFRTALSLAPVPVPPPPVRPGARDG